VYFRWLLTEGEIKEDPMVRVEKPQVAEEAKPFSPKPSWRLCSRSPEARLAVGGNVDDLMNVAGWRSIAMPLRYAKGQGLARAAEAHKRLSPGDRL